MIKFLLDANISFTTARYLEGLGYEVKTVAQLHLEQADDEVIVQYAVRHGFIVVTFDLDFGYLFRFLARNQLGMIILRLEKQTIESANAALKRVHDAKVLEEENNRTALIIVDESTIRTRR